MKAYARNKTNLTHNILMWNPKMGIPQVFLLLICFTIIQPTPTDQDAHMPSFTSTHQQEEKTPSSLSTPTDRKYTTSTVGTNPPKQLSATQDIICKHGIKKPSDILHFPYATVFFISVLPSLHWFFVYDMGQQQSQYYLHSSFILSLFIMPLHRMTCLFLQVTCLLLNTPFHFEQDFCIIQ